MTTSEERGLSAGRWTLAGVLVVLVVTDLLLTDQNMWLTVPIACLAVAVLLVLGRRAGLSWTQLGLGRRQLVSGLRWGSAAALLVAAGYLIFWALPIGRDALTDDTMPTTPRDAAIRILVVIPLRTILLEEIAFRGVLWGLLRRRGTATTATCWSAVAFGLWHVPAGLRFVGSNQALKDVVGESQLAAASVVVAIVIATGLAGLLFAELRRRSGSLLAPAGLHLAANGIGTFMSAVR